MNLDENITFLVHFIYECLKNDQFTSINFEFAFEPLLVALSRIAAFDLSVSFHYFIVFL